jgi:hypothetical protein
MKKLARYLELIVDPTFDDFHVNRGSIRLAFLTSVTIYHSIDRVAEETGKRAARLRQVDGLAHHFKHVKSNDEKIPASRPGIPIGFALGLSEAGDTMDLRNLYYVIRDAVRFVHRKAGTEHPTLPEPSAPPPPPPTARAAYKKR